MTAQRGLYLEIGRLLLMFLNGLLVIVLTPFPALAQGPLTNEILHNKRSEIDTTTPSTNTCAPPIVQPNAPAPHRVIDKKFIVLMGALGGAESLRFTTHKLVLDHEFDAGAPWVTSVPPNQHLVAKYAAIYASELLVAYELKKPHSWLPGDRIIRRLWWVYPASMVPIHIKNGVRSIRTQAPSCPVDECEAP
jgi:hypothetical protein